MKLVRWPAILLLGAAIAAMAATDRAREDETSVGDTIVRPVSGFVGDESDLSSVWYCSAGTIVPEGFADQELLIGNPSHRSGTARLLVVPVLAPTRIVLDPDEVDEATGERAVPAPEAELLAASTHTVAVGARSLNRVRIAALEGVVGEYSAVVVESDLGPLVVDHLISGPSGAGASPCATVSSDSWFLATGSTRKGAREVISVFNPFPGDAVLDLTFSVDGRTRSPEAYEGVVVRAGSVLPIDLTPVVTLAETVSTSIGVRTGRVVVERILLFDASEGPAGLGVAVGAPGGGPEWVFAAGAGGSAPAAIVVQNPSADEEAIVDIELWPAIPGNPAPEPVRVTVRPGHSETVVVSGSASSVSSGRLVDVGARLGSGEHWIVVRSVRGPDVVAERLALGSVSDPPAAGASTGAAAAATHHAFTVVGGRARLAVAHPAIDRIAVVELSAMVDGRLLVAAPVEVPAGGRVVMDLEALGIPQEAVVVVESNEPIFAERGLDLGFGLSWSAVAPFSGTLSDAPIPLF